MNHIISNKEQIKESLNLIEFHLTLIRDDQSKPLERDEIYSKSILQIQCHLTRLETLINNPLSTIDILISKVLSISSRVFEFDQYKSLRLHSSNF